MKLGGGYGSHTNIGALAVPFACIALLFCGFVVWQVIGAFTGRYDTYWEIECERVAAKVLVLREEGNDWNAQRLERNYHTPCTRVKVRAREATPDATE